MGSNKVPKLEAVERAAVIRALAETDSRSEAAEKLGIGRTTLYRKMDKYGLRRTNLGFGGVDAPDGDGLLGSLMEGGEE